MLYVVPDTNTRTKTLQGTYGAWRDVLNRKGFPRHIYVLVSRQLPSEALITDTFRVTLERSMANQILTILGINM